MFENKLKLNLDSASLYFVELKKLLAELRFNYVQIFSVPEENINKIKTRKMIKDSFPKKHSRKLLGHFDFSSRLWCF